MTDKFEIIPLEQLADIIFNQLNHSHSVFGIPREAFFKPHPGDPFQMNRWGHLLETPVGVAAGPHTQLAQNIISAWLTGARFIELKTVQTLDDLKISKPCIDMQDEGYNCEWSQELKIEQSFDQYLNAWIIIHLLREQLGHDAAVPGFLFNMSVGYDYQGVMKENVQWFLNKMRDASQEIEQKISEIEKKYPLIKKVHLAPTLSDNITLSTMHGCPPQEIESIGRYLISEKKLHTTVKLNPTLLGKEELLSIIRQSGFNTSIPDVAFEHDIQFDDAVKMIARLQQEAKQNGVGFGIKLTNTLESVNNKNVFPAKEPMMYMSGRALHPISVNVARKLQNHFGGTLDISFSGGADAFNVTHLLACGLKPVTVCSDILKPGGYGRLGQYILKIEEAFQQAGATSVEQYVEKINGNEDIPPPQKIVENLNRYADDTLEDKRYKNRYFQPPSIKTDKPLGAFDCIAAPCQNTCPTHQGIPAYMYYTAKGDFSKAYEVITETNPFPYTTGMVCDHQCTTKCTRINYDEPLKIREIKRFVTEYAFKHGKNPELQKKRAENKKVAVIGAGPSGLSCARYLIQEGFEVDVFEATSKPGGMVSQAIPPFRLTGEALQYDMDTIMSLGVRMHYNTPVDKHLFEQLQKDFDALFVAAGAQKSRKLAIEGGDAPCVVNPLEFLSHIKQKRAVHFKNKKIAIIGGGNTAIDAARTALRLTGNPQQVTLVYRRRIQDMPAEPEEIEALLAEGVHIIPLASPKKITRKTGQVCELTCIKMVPGETDKQNRIIPVPVPHSDFSLECNTVIPAVGQDLDFPFAPEELLKTKKGSYQTQIPHVYIGGDALRGASTVIHAVADGKKAAMEMVADLTDKKPEINHTEHPGVLYNELKLKKYSKKEAVKIPTRRLEKREDFTVLTGTYTPEQAMEEASRCLLCDEICDVCTTVCPNLAFHSFSVNPLSFPDGIIKYRNGQAAVHIEGVFEIKQKRQIIHLPDWCNQCGNCVTFCPTAGKPYQDKLHLYLLKSSFETNRDGFYYDANLQIIERFYETLPLQLKEEEDKYLLWNQMMRVEIDKKEFQIKSNTSKETVNIEIPLQIIWEMVVLLKGVKSFYSDF